MSLITMRNWKHINENYLVSDDGRVWSVRRRRLLKPGLLNSGYRQACLGKGKKESVHRLVAAAFLGPCPMGFQVNHKNSRRDDNRVSNLEYVTPTENQLHAVASGRMPVGEAHYRAKLTAEDVAGIRRRYRLRLGGVLAREYGVHVSLIHYIVRRQIWKSVA